MADNKVMASVQVDDRCSCDSEDNEKGSAAGTASAGRGI